MNLYATDLFDITICAACRPRDGYKLSFVECTPNKHEVIRAIEMEIDERNKALERARVEEDEVAEADAIEAIDKARLAIEIVKAFSEAIYSFEGPKQVIVAGTQIGFVKIEQREVWKNH